MVDQKIEKLIESYKMIDEMNSVDKETSYHGNDQEYLHKVQQRKKYFGEEQEDHDASEQHDL